MAPPEAQNEAETPTQELRPPRALKRSSQNIDDPWNRADPRSLINLVPSTVQDFMVRAFSVRPDLFGQDERIVYKALRTEGREPTPTDNRLRLKFWDEYDRAQAQLDRMQMVAVYTGVCSREYFSQRYLTFPEKVAWLMTPPASYVVKMEEALAFGIEQLRDVLEQPMFDSKGNFNTKLAELKAKIVAMLDLRVKGGVTQRVEQTTKSFNVTLSQSASEVSQAAVEASMVEIEKRLKELEKRDRMALPEKPAEIIVEQDDNGN